MAGRAIRRFPANLGASRRHYTHLSALLLLLLAAAFLPAPAAAQTLIVSNPGAGTVALGGKWQFHLGDNLAWANPSYNDSNWEQLSASEPWGAQTHPSQAGFAWYRRHITIDNSNPAATKNLAILIPPVDDVYDLYWNGKKIGAYGTMPPHASWWSNPHSATYRFPDVSGSTTETGVLALRVWKAQLSSVDLGTGGGLEAVPLIGDAKVLATVARLPYATGDEAALPTLLISAVVFVVGIFSLLLFYRDPRQRIYLWLAIYLIANGLHGVRGLSAFSFGLSFHITQLYVQLVISLQDISLWMILLYLFGMAQDRRWLRVTYWLIGIYLAAQAVDIGTIFLWARAWPSLPWIDAISTAVYCLTPLYIYFIVGYGLKRRKQLTLWPLIIVVCVNGLFNSVYQLAGQGRRFTHWTFAGRLLTIGVHTGGYFFGLIFILNIAIFLALIFTIAREQLLERERQSRVELEIKSAQEVQRILVPEDTPAIPGLSISSIYRPAEEVGGDFFQVIPSGNSGALIILGDVSGKGLKAAMTVSLIVGTIRTLADFTHNPAEILNGLNRRLLGRIDGGFATCVVARIRPDGSATIANAGHLAPYRNGEELPVAGSLPLGVMSDAEYGELDLRLHEGDSLIFYTDGLVEARSESGELYGFDRVSALVSSAGSVEEIVDAACAFGQEDDITVLRLTRLAHSAPAHESRINLAAQIARA